MRLDIFPAGESNRRKSEHYNKVGELLAWIWRPREPWGTENAVSASASHLPNVGIEPMGLTDLSEVKPDMVWKEVDSAEFGGLGAFLVCFILI